MSDRDQENITAPLAQTATNNSSRHSLARNNQVSVVVYSPASPLRHPLWLLRAMWKDLLAAREMGWRLTVRDIRARYRQSLLGIFWAFVAPVSNALVFIFLNSQGVVNFGDTGIPYPVYAIFGTVLWQLFAESIAAPLNSVNTGKAILPKLNFPREALILSGMGQVLFNFGIKLLILIAVFIIFGMPVTAGLLLAPLAMLCLLLLGITIGLFLTPLGVLYSDVPSALQSVLTVWFFLTPVIYPPTDRWPMSLLTSFNPVGPLLSGSRDLATIGFISDPQSFFIVTALTLVGLFFAWVLYRLSLPILIERISA